MEGEKMTPEEFKKEMQKIADEYGTEDGHIEADDLMIKLLKELGYEEGAEIFDRMYKWYS